MRGIRAGIPAAALAAAFLCAPVEARAQGAVPPAALPSTKLPPVEPPPARLPPVELPDIEPPPAKLPPAGKEVPARPAVKLPDTLPPPDLDGRQEGGPGLPPAPGRIGRVRRGADGKLVPDGPALPPDSGEVGSGYPSLPPAVGGVPMNRGTHPSGTPALRFYDPRALDEARSRSEHDIAARRHQLEIDRLIREEKTAREGGEAENDQGLTAREAALAQELERADRAVRDHEMAHYFAAQPHSAFPEYWYVRGPLGRRYAVSGITRMDASEIEGDASGSLIKLQKLRRAALAPRDPSDEDRRVAAAIDRLIETLRSRPAETMQRRRSPAGPLQAAPRQGEKPAPAP